MTTRTLAVLVAFCGLLSACEKEEPTAQPSESFGDAMEDAADNAADDLENAAGDAADQLEDRTGELKAQAVAAAEDRMTAFETRLEDLETRLDAASEDVKTEAKPLLDSARSQFDAIGEKINELRAAGAAEWEAVSGELMAALDALGESIAQAAAKLGG
jgi:DNA anti-recombination protein RmuC